MDNKLSRKRTRYHFDNLYHTSEQMHMGPYLVLQLGDINCEPGLRYPPHRQPVHEVSYVVSGKGVFSANGVNYPVHRGSLFVNASDDLHEVRASSDDPFRYMYLGFRAQKPITLPSIQTLEDYFSNPRTRCIHEAFEVQETFIRLLNELVVADNFSSLLKECCIHQLLCQVFRLMNPSTQRSYLLSEGQKTDTEKLVYNMAQHIDSHIGCLKRLTDLSEQFGYSYPYIARVFSQHMGESLHAYYTRRRFEKSVEFLAQGLSVTDISRMLGYQSIHAFSRAFKQEFNLSPRDYSKQLLHRSIEKVEG